MTRVLILGGTHFVGPHVVAGLVERGCDVTVFHSGKTENPLSDSARHVHGRFGDFAENMAGLLELRPQVVVDVVPYYAKNGHGVLNFADVAERAVVVTSVDVYRAFARLHGTEPGAPDPVPLAEDAPVRTKPSPDLDESIDFDNRDVERAVVKSVLPTTILRMPAIFGPGDPFNRLYRYVKRMDDARPAILLDERVASWRWSRGYVRNVAQALVLAATEERAAGRTYNVAPLQTHTEEEWVRLVAEVHGWRGSVIRVDSNRLPAVLRAGLAFAQDIVLDSSRIRTELGYSELVPLREALATTIDWERAHPPADVTVDYAAEDAVLAEIA